MLVVIVLMLMVTQQVDRSSTLNREEELKEAFCTVYFVPYVAPFVWHAILESKL
jgi:hypothetical protein